MSVPFTFPVSTDDFVAYQEKLLGCPLTDNMRWVVEAWVPAFNDSFSEGLENDLEALEQWVSCMDRFMKKHSDNVVLTKFLSASRCWIIYAWERGKESAATVLQGGCPY